MYQKGERIDFNDLCNTYSLPDIVQSYGISLKRAGREWQGCCPFHAEKSPSFTIFNDGDRERFKCFGCGESGDVVTFIEKICKVETKGAIAILNGKNVPSAVRVEKQKPLPKNFDDKENIERAKRIYRHAERANGTPVESYLLSRGIDLEKIGGIPASLRYGEIDYWHPRVGQDKPEKIGTFPAMIAPIQQADGSVTGIHITYLDKKSFQKINIPDPDRPNAFLKAKKMRGIMRCGCIRLAPVSEHLMIAEGIETALSVKTAIAGTKLDKPVWTCLSLSNLSTLILPSTVRQLTILADNDMKVPKNESQKDPREFLRECALRLKKRGINVFVAWPEFGKDFNDMLKASK